MLEETEMLPPSPPCISASPHGRLPPSFQPVEHADQSAHDRCDRGEEVHIHRRPPPSKGDAPPACGPYRASHSRAARSAKPCKRPTNPKFYEIPTRRGGGKGRAAVILHDGDVGQLAWCELGIAIGERRAVPSSSMPPVLKPRKIRPRGPRLTGRRAMR